MMGNSIFECLLPHVGQTVTVFTASGGLSGSGFTGVLIGADPRFIELHCAEAAPPACPIGSGCTGPIGSAPIPYNPLGAISRIPVCAIVAFVHHAV